ncbi:MAG: hypothetical protein K8R25_11735 [Methanosarcinales archaeon]|nr:hypothetical protein [Methanosarcinales archaeon]
MADKNKKPWYKDTRYLSLIIVIVAIVITIIIWLWPIPPPPISIDPMESTRDWYTFRDDHGSSINRKLIPGKTGNSIEIAYDLKEWGWVTLNRRIDPSILSEIEGIRFFYKGTGKPNTIEFKLSYSDGDEYNGTDTTFGFLINAATVKDGWTQVDVPYDMLECWWSDKSCDDNPRLDLNKVRKIEFTISNKPKDGDLYGSGKVIIDDVQGIGSEDDKDGSFDTRYLGSIIAIIAIVVAIIIWRWPKRPPPLPNFSISIDPMLGGIQAGGVTPTTVSVISISGYDHTVSLSVTGEPSGVVIAFVPKFGAAKPLYTSTMMINVDKNVLAGDYTLVIKGTGADGKEQSCSYTLTVKPSLTPRQPVTSPSPTSTITPTPSLTVPPSFSFVFPNKNDYVSHYVPAKVKVGNVPGINDMWFVTIPPTGKYHPQGHGIPYNGLREYDIAGYVGQSGRGADTGVRFRILIVGADKEASDSMEKYLSTAADKGWPGLDELPSTSKTLGSVNVTRNDDKVKY